MTRQRIFVACAAALLLAVPSAHAETITFTGLTGAGQGLIGHAFVPRAGTNWNAEYAALGVAGPYTRLVSPDAFDFTTGGELALGANLPAQPFGATVAAPHGLAAIGFPGPLHLSVAGLTLDYLNLADSFFSDAFHETRFYRNGTGAIFEETGPGVYNPIATYSDLVMQISIDYTTGSILSTTTGVRSGGTPAFFPDVWQGISFDPIDNAGSTTEGVFGRFSTQTDMEFDTSPVPEPGTLALVGLGLGFAAWRRRRR